MSIENIKDFLEDVLALKEGAWKNFDKYIENKSFDKEQIKHLVTACKSTDKPGEKRNALKILKAKLLLHGIGYKPEPYKAVALLHSVKKEGQAIAQYYLGNYYLGEDVKQASQKAFHYYSQAAKQNYLPALFQLATCYYFGHGVDINRAEIKSIYERIAQFADAETLYELACHYEDGHLIESDHQEAARLYLLAATKGNADAQYRYALCLARGKGVDKSLSESIYYLDLAGNQNHAKALYLLGKYFFEGKGVKQNEKTALVFYSKAAAMGDEAACYQMATCLEQGIGTSQDLYLASTFYFQSYLKSAREASFERLTLLAQDNAQAGVSACTYLFLIHYLDIHVLGNKDEANKFFDKNPKEVITCLYFILPQLLDDFDVSQEALNNLATFLLVKVCFHSFLPIISIETQEKIFSGLTKLHKDHINSGYDDDDIHTEKLEKMASLGIVGAKKALDACFSYRARLLKTLLDENRGDIEHHLFLLDKFSMHGNQKAKNVSQQYHKRYAEHLLKQALDNNNDALMRLSRLALSRPECDTALGMYCMKQAQEKAAAKPHTKMLFFKSAPKSGPYYQKAYFCFVRAAGAEYGPALYQLAVLMAKGTYVEQNPSKALYYAFRAGQAGYMGKAGKFIERFTKDKDESLAISALIYQALLTDNKAGFKNDRFLKQAYHKNRHLFAERIEKIISNVKLLLEKKLDLLNAVSCLKLKSTMKAQLGELQKNIIYEKISSTRGYHQTLDITWVKHTKPETFIACVLVMACDHAKYSFNVRALHLFTAKRVAEIHHLSTRSIDKMLASGYCFEDAETEIITIKEKIDQDLPLSKPAEIEKADAHEKSSSSAAGPVLCSELEKPALATAAFHAAMLPHIATPQIRPASPRPKQRNINSRHKQAAMHC